MTAQEYAEHLEANLADLYERWRRGRYRAPPVRRTDLDTEDGSQRPIGIPAFEDKLVQRAVVMLLGAIYEQDFSDGSHGFREGHSPHQALHELREQCMDLDIGWIVDADGSAGVDSLDHDLVRERLRRRIVDGTIVGRMGKWRKAGVVEGGTLTYPERGSPQGGVVSPILANIVLHDVLDAWVEQTVRPRMKGHGFLLRFADDVRHITGHQIPFPERRGSEDQTPGSTTYLNAKAGGNNSMSIKRRRSEGVYGLALQDPRDTVRATLPKPQSPAMEAYIP